MIWDNSLQSLFHSYFKQQTLHLLGRKKLRELLHTTQLLPQIWLVSYRRENNNISESNDSVLVFCIICSLTYFRIKTFARIKQKISCLHSFWTPTILAVKSIWWLCHQRNCKPFPPQKTEDPRNIFRIQSNIQDGAFSKID